MAFFAYKLAGSMIVPPGLFILCLVALALSLARKKNGKGYAAFALLLALGLYIFSTPAGARLLAGDVEDVKASLPPVGTKAAILVLGGGVSYGGTHYPDEPGALATLRLLAALEVSKNNPGPVIVTGGLPWKPGEATTAEVMARALRRMGFKGEILMAGRTRTTREDLVRAGEIMESLKLGHLVLVTNAFHMKRALWLAARHVHGAELHPFPAGHLVDRVPLRPLDFLPTADMAGAVLFRERVGLAVERLKFLFS